MIYSGATIALGLVFPRLEYRYLHDFAHGMTAPIATALFSSIASGMLAFHRNRFFFGVCHGAVQQHRLFTPSGFLAQSRSA